MPFHIVYFVLNPRNVEKYNRKQHITHTSVSRIDLVVPGASGLKSSDLPFTSCD